MRGSKSLLLTEPAADDPAASPAALGNVLTISGLGALAPTPECLDPPDGSECSLQSASLAWACLAQAVSWVPPC